MTKYNVEIYNLETFETRKVIWKDMTFEKARDRESIWLTRINENFWVRIVRSDWWSDLIDLENNINRP